MIEDIREHYRQNIIRYKAAILNIYRESMRDIRTSDEINAIIKKKAESTGLCYPVLFNITWNEIAKNHRL
jgi:hypothetical protein